MPGSPAPLEPACLFRYCLVGQPNLAIGCAADPNRDPGNLHDTDRARFSILNVETNRLWPSWDRLLLEPRPQRAALPTLDKQVRAAGEPAIPGSTQGAGRDGHGGKFNRPVYGG